MLRKTSSTFLRDFLLVAPLSHALWRSVEALCFNAEKLNAPVLDLGCGFGEFAGVVFGKLECGIDVNKKDLKMALSGNKYDDVIYADARRLPFKKSSYSSVISVSVMEHISNVPRVIKEVNRVLKKGGVFVFTVPTKELYDNLFFPTVFKQLGILFLADWYVKLHKKAFVHQTIKTSRWWENELKKANFKIIKKQGTISSTLVKLHDLFLMFAFPSQIWRWLFGKRLILFRIRAKIFPRFFSKYVFVDEKSTSNIFVVAKKI
jgi:ubiquinone/menaquinone biosynthesis C-methylase UbiE